MNEKEFETHSTEIETNDMIYIFYDGYYDQFGENKNKKFMSRRFKKLLIENHKRKLKEQQQVLLEAFKWLNLKNVVKRHVLK